MTSYLLMIGLSAALALLVGAAWCAMKRRNMHLWVGSYYCQRRPRAARLSDDRPLHVFLAVCDHYEPEWHRPSKRVSIERVERWCREYPRRFERFRDSDGRPPQHTFFFPQDEYAPEYLDLLSSLCSEGFGDVDIHLHHDGDTAAAFREKLEEFRDTLAYRHGLLRHDPITGNLTYGFIHGNWALCNSRPDGRWCGVSEEIPILIETGCYADFTMPSAPSDTQTRTINSIYYASDVPGYNKSHDQGVGAQVGVRPPENSLLMVQGPLAPDWSQRKWGVLPRIENGDLHGYRAPTMHRMKQWLDAGVHVAGRPDWLFIKLHTHGCKEVNTNMLLGQPMVDFHHALESLQNEHRNLRLHYVTAWEMARLVHQAESGATVPECLIAGKGMAVVDPVPGSRAE